MREIELTRRHRRSRRCASTIPSGPYTDPAAAIDIRAGLPALARRVDLPRAAAVVEDDRRSQHPPREDNGLKARRGRARFPRSTASRPSVRCAAKAGGVAVWQYAYARRGIVTAEMEYIAIRENLGRARAKELI